MSSSFFFRGVLSSFFFLGMKGMGSESASGGAMEKGLMSSCSFEGGHRVWAQRGRM